MVNIHKDQQLKRVPNSEVGVTWVLQSTAGRSSGEIEEQDCLCHLRGTLNTAERMLS